MLSIEQTKQIAGLARIGATEKELEKFSNNLSMVLGWIDQLEEVGIDNISATTRTVGLINVSREDKAVSFKERSSIIKLFPEEKNGYVKVRSVL